MGSHERAPVLRRFQLPTAPERLLQVRDEGASHSRERFVYSRAFSDAPEVQDPATCVYPARCIDHGMHVVREHWVSSGEALLPAYRRTLYSYEKPRMDLRGRGFLGFGELRVWDPDGYHESVTTFDNLTRVLVSGREVYPYAGRAATLRESVVGRGIAAACAAGAAARLRSARAPAVDGHRARSPRHTAVEQDHRDA